MEKSRYYAKVMNKYVSELMDIGRQIRKLEERRDELNSLTIKLTRWYNEKR